MICFKSVPSMRTRMTPISFTAVLPAPYTVPDIQEELKGSSGAIY